jgi:membrane-associated protease RseP (regulator of RpoE activity)
MESTSNEESSLFSEILEASSGRLAVRNVVSTNNVVTVELAGERPDYGDVAGVFGPLGYDAFLRERDGRYYVFLMTRPEEKGKGRFSGSWVYLALFAATVASTFFAGYLLSVPLVDEGLMGSAWAGAASFSFGLMAILGLHEMGHKIQSIRSGISSSWPYFIPMPFLPLGTLGALIKMKSPIPTKDDAVKLGASGPLVGVAVAIPVTIMGLKLSYIVPSLPGSAEGGYYLGNSLLFWLLSVVSIDVPAGMELWIHPLAFAGWVGLFVTMLNLLPAGQLDGGHVVRALFGDRGHRRISSWVVKVLLILGSLGFASEMGIIEGFGQYTWSGWLVWGILAHFVTKGGHPGPLDELTPLSSRSKAVAVLALAAFVLCFVPVPIVMA